jgi:UDP-3-O-[3-hydroxymyristoyl] N-acetylglucosamine deacetylase/3-hydroxyacyl-[acyl-carrier-protein] dehydratase
VLHQQTLRQPAAFSGIGLHGGNCVNMTFLPAPPGSGIRFRRVDLEGMPEVEAGIENVSATARSTSLSRGNVKIQTVEHVLAAFAGRGIDNAIVELDSGEPPIGDGSARPYMKMIRDAGAVAQDAPREVFRVQNPLCLERGETTLSVFPHDGFKITCTSADARGRYTQFYEVEVTPESWERDLGHARTFCFFEEIEALIKNGLIKGGSLENAVVIRDDAVLTTEPLRYPEEFVRHKMLDIVGDLSLLGKPIRGHIIAVRPGHAANAEMVRKIVAQINQPIRAQQTFAPPPVADAPAPPPAAEGAMDIEELMKFLPHRPPFLLVDRIVKIEGMKIVGIKNVTMNEPFFPGHFPGHPIMPGVLQLEAMAQVAGVLLLKIIKAANQVAYFMAADNVKWRRPVVPGDVLIMEIELTKARGKIGKAKCLCKVAGEIVSEADVTFMLRDA